MFPDDSVHISCIAFLRVVFFMSQVHAVTNQFEKFIKCVNGTGYIETQIIFLNNGKYCEYYVS